MYKNGAKNGLDKENNGLLETDIPITVNFEFCWALSLRQNVVFQWTLPLYEFCP